MVYLLHQLLSRSATKYPDKEAVVFKDATMTYAQLDAESGKLAAKLLEIGVQRGDRVGIHMNRSIDSVVGVFGILKAGAAYVPMDPASPSNRLSYIVNTCGIQSVLTSKEKLPNIERVSSETQVLKNIIAMNGINQGPKTLESATLLDWQKIREAAEYTAPRNGVDSDLAYVLFTSGSTGNPKGVMISHLNSLTFVNSAHDFFDIQPTDRFSNLCPLHFDMSIFDLFVAFKAGATVAIIPETTAVFPSELAKFIDKHQITVWNSVPSALSLLANYSNLHNHDLSSLRLMLFAGEVLPVKYIRLLRVAAPSASFYNVYGQTEANSSTCFPVDVIPSNDETVLPIGRPFPNFDVFALDDDGRQVASCGEKGELYVRASSVALGYWNDVERTGERFVPDPLRPYSGQKVYKTGDLVSLDEAGNYTFLGRKDHMIKSRGYRIEIGEIESVLSCHPCIRSTAVVPIPDELIGNRIIAVVVPAKKDAIEKTEIMAICAARLPKYMIPEIVEFRDSLPMTSSGKIDRQKLGVTIAQEIATAKTVQT